MSKVIRLASVFAIVAGLICDKAVRAEDHEGPHKGTLVEWGDEEYHLELVTDAKAGTVTVYVYGDHKDFEKGKAKAIDAKSLVLTVKGEKSVTIKLDAAPAKGDPAGKTSVYTAKHDVFAKGAKLEGSVSGKVGTKPYTGDFKQK